MTGCANDAACVRVGREATVPTPAGSIGRVVNKIDFELMLSMAARSRSTHFAVHHAARKPSAAVWTSKRVVAEELSTAEALVCAQPVDELPSGHWLGTVVPKRHARRSVTRSLIKRQIRAAMSHHAGRLPAGLWLVRLRAPFAVTQFPSAASPALRQAVRAELEQLFSRAAS